jgi:heme exporter protein A
MTLPLRLKAEKLSCERGGRLVFSNLSFNLQAGEMLELRGANGSGKSTLLRLLAGLNIHSAGSIILENGSAELSLAEQAHYIGHADANKPALTVGENLKFWSHFMGGNNPPLSTFNLAALSNDQALLLSAGQKRRLTLSRLNCAARPIWLLDEPDVGLDSASRLILQTEIKKHLESGGMVLAATHTDLGLKSARSLVLGKVM